MNLEQIYAPIRQDMEKVEERLTTLIASEVYPVYELYSHVLLSGGKRIRPALVLLSAKSLDCDCSNVIDLACAVELIHMASLIHDDIIDSATLRRGRPSAQVIWNNQIAVITGDYLFSQAMELLTHYENHEVARAFSRAVKYMAEGELLQIANHKNIELTEQKYVDIISHKTATLMAVSCQATADIASVTDEYHIALSRYGMNLGISYQIMDDVLDLISTDDELGKPVGNSIREGNLTLPIIYMLRNGNGKLDKERILSLLIDAKEIDDIQLQEVMDMITSSAALPYTQEIARGYANNAKGSLAVLSDSTARRCLLALADFVIDRQPAEANML